MGMTSFAGEKLLHGLLVWNRSPGVLHYRYEVDRLMKHNVGTTHMTH